MVEQTPLKRKVTGSSPVWPIAGAEFRCKSERQDSKVRSPDCAIYRDEERPAKPSGIICFAN